MTQSRGQFNRGAPTGGQDVDRVRAATDLVALIGEHVKLTPKGREHVGLCPFHDDRSPSMHVVTHKGDGFYKCFACGASGDCYTFVKEYHRVDFGEALRMLADRAGIPLTPRRGERSGGDGPDRGDLIEACRFAAEFFQQTLAHQTKGATGREVVERRGISPEMIEAFGIGYAPPGFDNLRGRLAGDAGAERAAVAAGLLRKRDGGGSYDAFRNRLIFPIRDDLGRPIAFGARAIAPDDEPKYLNSPETRIFSKSQTLYGLDRARRAIVDAGLAIVTEGYTDVVACHQAGVENVVGTLGTALTDGHAQRLSRLCRDVVLVFDGDEAGQRAADRAVAVFFRAAVDVRVCVLPGGADPDEYLAAHGADGFRARVDEAEDALSWKLGRFRESLSPSMGISGRQAILESFLDELVDLGFASMDTVRRSLVLDQLQRLLRVPATELARLIAERSRDADRRRRTRAAREAERAANEAATPATTAAPAPRSTPPARESMTDADGRPLVAPEEFAHGDDPEDDWAPPMPDGPVVETMPASTTAGGRTAGTPARTPALAVTGPLARARAVAERTLAGLALRDAAAFRAVLTELEADAEAEEMAGLKHLPGGDDDPPAPLAERLTRASRGDERLIADPAAAAVMAAIADWLCDPEAGPAPTVPEVMRLSDANAGPDVAQLYFDAEAIDAAAEEPGRPAIRESIRTFADALQRERAAEAHDRARLEAAAGSLDVRDLAALVEARRERGAAPEAIARRPDGPSRGRGRPRRGFPDRRGSGPP